MKTIATLALFAAALIVNDLYRCPCQETRKTDRDRAVVACNGSNCTCGCEAAQV